MSKKFMVIYIIVLLILGAAVILLMQSGMAKSIPADALSSLKNNVAEPNDLAANEANLSFEASSKVTIISEKIGDSVAAGEVLAKIDDTAALAQYSQAQAGVTVAQSNLAALENALKAQKLTLKGLHSNAKKIQDKQISLAEDNVHTQQAVVQQAEDNLSNVQSQLDKYEIKAPFAGVITKEDIVLGEVATANVPVITIQAK